MTRAWINWAGIAVFLGYKPEDVDLVRELELFPTIARVAPAPEKGQHNGKEQEAQGLHL